uniref:Uncharacterized protein n=1 Tax=Opuntia streptacantha TaxID=393608 RepID=A0A7C9AGZ5_OPUST
MISHHCYEACNRGCTLWQRQICPIHVIKCFNHMNGSRAYESSNLLPIITILPISFIKACKLMFAPLRPKHVSQLPFLLLRFLVFARRKITNASKSLIYTF